MRVFGEQMIESFLRFERACNDKEVIVFLPLLGSSLLDLRSQLSRKVPVHTIHDGWRASPSRVASSFFSLGFLRRSAGANRKHGHNGSSPLDRGCEKRWGKDRPVDHDIGSSLRRIGLSSCDRIGPEIEW